MAKTFLEMVAAAQASVPGISPQEAQRRVQEVPDTLLIDVQDLTDIQAGGSLPGAVPISLGMLAIRADLELPAEFREPRLHDRNRPVIITCGLGGQAALGADLLRQMGFTNVAFIDGGNHGWMSCGLPMQRVQGA